MEFWGGVGRMWGVVFCYYLTATGVYELWHGIVASTGGGIGGRFIFVGCDRIGFEGGRIFCNLRCGFCAVLVVGLGGWVGGCEDVVGALFCWDVFCWGFDECGGEERVGDSMGLGGISTRLRGFW